MGDIKRRCIGCMREIEDVQVCPYCGYDEKTAISGIIWHRAPCWKIVI